MQKGYEEPTIEVIEVMVEQGFAGSGEGSGEGMGTPGWGII